MTPLITKKNVPLVMVRLGELLKKLREDMGLSMHKVSKKHKALTPSYISKIEATNKYKSMTIEALVAFSKVYEIPVNVLLEKSGFLEESKEEQLPGLATYLKIKYNASYQLIKDMEVAWEILKGKYKK